MKIIWKNTPTFFDEVKTIIHKHFPHSEKTDIVKQTSGQDNYISITATVHVHDQATLDALYRELTAHPDMKMVL